VDVSVPVSAASASVSASYLGPESVPHALQLPALGADLGPLGPQLRRILLARVVQVGPLGVAVGGALVEVDLGVERHHLAALGHHQRIDLGEGRILLDE